MMAIVLATTGSALAARASVKAKPKPKPIVLTGANIKDASLTDVDFRAASLGSTLFARTSLTELAIRGTNGAAGALGDPGPRGSIGGQGKYGEKGAAAPRAYTFQTAEQSLRVKGDDPNPSSLMPASYCTHMNIPNDDRPVGCANDGSGGSPIEYRRWNYRCSHFGDLLPTARCNTGAISVPRLTRSSQSLVVTSNNASGGLLVMHTAGTIVLNGSATFFTQRTSVNQRLECQLQVARVENGQTQAPLNVGVPAVVQRHVNPTTGPNYRNERERLVTISATGAIAQEAGVFETIIACRAPDDTGQPNDRLEFIEGNLSVLTTRTNGSLGG